MHVVHNLDDMARTFGDSDDPSVRGDVWRQLSARLLDNLKRGVSPLVLDHVVDSTTIAELVIPAKELNYQILLWVICPKNADICVNRVSIRKSEGGHGAHADAVRALYRDALEVASELSIIADETILVDSTSEFVIVGHIRNFEFRQLSGHVPLWVHERFSTNKGYKTPVKQST